MVSSFDLHCMMTTELRYEEPLVGETYESCSGLRDEDSEILDIPRDRRDGKHDRAFPRSSTATSGSAMSKSVMGVMRRSALTYGRTSGEATSQSIRWRKSFA